MSRLRALPVLAIAVSAGVAAATLSVPAGASPPTTPAPKSAERHRDADLDVLFVGAHPDDEAFALSTYGQWGEDDDVRTGVLTITRGEGGGNAVGPEEGPALGLIREAEERRAVSRAGITDVYNIDEVDFFYTVSAALTEQVWGHDSTLRKVVRVVRETTPEVIVTMDPAPSPGNHGNHQYAGRMALEAFHAAGDPAVFPRQLGPEGLATWAADKVLLGSARGESTGTGADCPTEFDPVRPTQDLYGVWSGTESTRWGTTWAAVERVAQRKYKSQGWAGFPDVPSDPDELGCDMFTQVDARVPYVRGDLGADTTDPTTVLRGSLLRAPGDLPLGTRLSVDPDPFSLAPGTATTLTVRARAPQDRALGRARLHVRAPAGWTVAGDGPVGRLGAGERVVREVTVTTPDDTNTRRVTVSATLRAQQRSGSSWSELDVVPPVQGTQQLLPQVRQFQRWAVANDYPQLEGFVAPVLPLASGGSRRVRVQVSNEDTSAHRGRVRLQLPDGFATPTTFRPYPRLAPGDSTVVHFRVTNTDDSLPTSNEGGDEGDYGYTIRTSVRGGGTSDSAAALELVPTTAIRPAPQAPQVDGTVGAGEYAGQPLDLSRLWEGEDCASTADCSATGHLSRHGNRLFVGVEVVDDTLGTALAPSDCKRHWRTDSVEIAIDPTGDSENTVSTFKMAVLPRTDDAGGGDGGPCYERDADHHQGPGPQTAPGVAIASSTSGDGWVVEASIPARELPETVDPDAMGLNLFVYDSDTQDLTGQTRIGWSTWGGVQGDPYRWGVARLPGWDPPTVEATAPVVPTEALSSLRSPQSIAQAAHTGVPLAGGPAAAGGHRAWVADIVRVSGNDVRVRVHAQARGVARLFVHDRADGTVAAERVRLGPGDHGLWLEVDGAVDVHGARVLMSWEPARGGGSWSSARRIP